MSDTDIASDDTITETTGQRYAGDGYLYLAVLMHKAGAGRLVITSEEMDAMVSYVNGNKFTLVVNQHDGYSSIEFLDRSRLNMDAPTSSDYIN